MSSTKRHVTVEEVEDSGEQVARDQSSAQQPSAFVYDACESAKQTCAPSERNAGWEHVDIAEARARKEREVPDAESHQERRNAEQTAHMMDEYLQGQTR